MGSTGVLVYDPCPCDSPEILIAAHRKPYTDPWADPKSRSTLGLSTIYSIGVLESRIDFLDSPESLKGPTLASHLDTTAPRLLKVMSGGVSLRQPSFFGPYWLYEDLV